MPSVIIHIFFSHVIYRYVSRVAPNDSSRHVILGTQQFKPKEFANQIALDMDNAWGILRVIIDTCLKCPEGKYLLLRDPNKVCYFKLLALVHEQPIFCHPAPLRILCENSFSLRVSGRGLEVRGCHAEVHR